MQGIKLLVKGEYACFTEPWSKAERKSYDVITPSAARGIIEAIYWKPAIRWVIDRLHVLEPIKFIHIRRNEVAGKLSPKGEVKPVDINANRQQRAMMALRNVRYGIEAHFEMTGIASEEESDTQDKHFAMFCERAKNGQHFHQPALGMREFDADCTLVEQVSEFGESNLDDSDKNKDFGWMLYDMCYPKRNEKGKPYPITYRAVMENGIIDVNACLNRNKS